MRWFDYSQRSSSMPKPIISLIFGMLSIYDHADLSSVSRLMNQISSLPASSYGFLRLRASFVSECCNNRAYLFNWTHDLAAIPSLGGRVLGCHIRTRRVIIRQHIDSEKFQAFNAALKTLQELKWCSHLRWHLNGFDLTSISGMTSLQHLNIEWGGGGIFTIPLESLPSLTSLSSLKASFANLAKIPNPLLLHHLAITEIFDWSSKDDGIEASFTQLFRFKSLHTLQLGGTSDQYLISRSRLTALLASLTQLQRLCISSIEPLSTTELKESPTTWFGSIPLSLNDITYFQRDGDLTSLLGFPSLSKLELYWPCSNWNEVVELLAPKLVSLTFPGVRSFGEVLPSIAKCTRLTSLIINNASGANVVNFNELKALPLKKLDWHVSFDGNILLRLFIAQSIKRLHF
jgi:hypothetical protein